MKNEGISMKQKSKKIKKHIVIEESILTIAQSTGTGNVSKFFNAAAKNFIKSKSFQTYIKENERRGAS